MYFQHKYPERRQQIAQLFPPALEHGFEIYSRHAGGDARYQFPEPFDQYVVGRLPYSEMVKAYRRYKVFLNLNSVPNSKSMCARRVYELSAAKTAVVGMDSEAIRSVYNDQEILLAKTEAEVAEIYQFLLNDDLGRRKLVQRAWRKTIAKHTYTDRIEQVAATLGIPPKETDWRIHIVFQNVQTVEELDRLLETLLRQKIDAHRDVIVTWSLEESLTTEIDVTSRPGFMSPSSISDPTSFGVLTPECSYGDSYLQDLLLMLRQQRCAFVAKSNASRVDYLETEERFANRLPEWGWLSAEMPYDALNLARASISKDSIYLGDPFEVADVTDPNGQRFLHV